MENRKKKFNLKFLSNSIFRHIRAKRDNRSKYIFDFVQNDFMDFQKRVNYPSASKCWQIQGMKKRLKSFVLNRNGNIFISQNFILLNFIVKHNCSYVDQWYTLF